MRFFLSEDVRLITDRLEVHQYSFFDEIPSFALNTFIVIPHRTERSGLYFVSENVYHFTAVVEGAGL
jgi:hypothetical protein